MQSGICERRPTCENKYVCLKSRFLQLVSIARMGAKGKVFGAKWTKKESLKKLRLSPCNNQEGATSLGCAGRKGATHLNVGDAGLLNHDYGVQTVMLQLFSVPASAEV